MWHVYCVHSRNVCEYVWPVDVKKNAFSSVGFLTLFNMCSFA